MMMLASPAAAAGEEGVRAAETPEITVNGTILRSGMPAEIRNGGVFLPLTQSLAEVLGADLDVILDEKGLVSARLLFREYELKFREGGGEMTVNGRQVLLSGAAYASAGGVLMAPAADLFRALGSEVDWNEKTMTLRVTRSVKTTGILDRIPGEVLGTPEGGSPAGREPPPPKEEQQPAALNEAQLDEYLSGGKRIQYAFEHSFSAEADTVSGDRGRSWVLPRQAFSNKFSIRAKGETQGGWDMDGILRIGSTTERNLKKSELQRFNISLAKKNSAVVVYDLLPRFTRFALRNYRLQGIDVSRKSGKWTFESVAGKTPKKYRDSEYARYVYGTRVMRGTPEEHVAVNYVATRDTGSRRATSQMDNQFVGVSAQGEFQGNWKWSSEYAGSSTRINSSGVSSSGRAFNFQSRRSMAADLLEIGYETTGAGFVSETAYFTSGISEFSVMYNRRLNPDCNFGLGNKYRTLRGSRSYITPKLFSIRPFDRYHDLKIELRHDTEHTSGASFSLVENRSVDVSHRIAGMDLRVSLGRRKNRTGAGPAAVLSTTDWRAAVPLSKKTTAILLSNIEKRRAALSPMSRMSRVTLSREIGEWSDISVSTERFYNNTDSNRRGVSLAFRSLDIETDREIIIEYSFMNYSMHNDQSSRLMYNIYK